MHTITRLPSVCQRCYQPVSRAARMCPACGESLVRFHPLRALTILVGVLLVAAALVGGGYLLYYLYLNTPE